MYREQSVKVRCDVWVRHDVAPTSQDMIGHDDDDDDDDLKHVSD